ncbi:MAG: hypothetical protein PUH18_04305 [Coriobacteriaceae bacterium]|nr:hypothetical protein [Coriobacteriaceae bacterium]
MDSLYQDWLNARENARQAIADIEEEGRRKAAAEADYYAAKSAAYARLLSEGNATAAGNMVKGDADVNRALFEFRLAESRYKAATMAANLFIDEEAHCYSEYKMAMSGDAGR